MNIRCYFFSSHAYILFSLSLMIFSNSCTRKKKDKKQEEKDYRCSLYIYSSEVTRNIIKNAYSASALAYLLN